MPDRLYREVIGWERPSRTATAAAMCFLPQEEGARRELESRLGEIVETERQRLHR